MSIIRNGRGRIGPIDYSDEWRPVGDGTTEVSRAGRVRRVYQVDVQGRSFGKGGYLRLKINQKDRCVHDLVAEAFLGPKPIGMTVNHKDGNKLNNNADNLEYLSAEDNIRHSWENGGHAKNIKLKNDDVLRIKAEIENVERGRFKKDRAASLAAEFGVSINTIFGILYNGTRDAAKPYLN